VVPGATSCLRCHDLHRTDADPAWPALALAWEQQAAPLAGSSGPAGPLLAAASARQALAWLHGGRPASLGSTLEEQPDGRIVRVRWSVHPGCGCGWASQSADGDAPAESGERVQ
jgi:hypothetical protein